MHSCNDEHTTNLTDPGRNRQNRSLELSIDTTVSNIGNYPWKHICLLDNSTQLQLTIYMHLCNLLLLLNFCMEKFIYSVSHS